MERVAAEREEGAMEGARVVVDLEAATEVVATEEATGEATGVGEMVAFRGKEALAVAGMALAVED